MRAGIRAGHSVVSRVENSLTLMLYSDLVISFTEP